MKSVKPNYIKQEDWEHILKNYPIGTTFKLADSSTNKEFKILLHEFVEDANYINCIILADYASTNEESLDDALTWCVFLKFDGVWATVIERGNIIKTKNELIKEMFS